MEEIAFSAAPFNKHTSNKTNFIFKLKGGMDYFGKGLSRIDLEVRGLRIDAAHRQDEPELMASRWFDYAELHPVAATYLYAHYYKRQTRFFYATVCDINSVEEARAFTPDDIFMSRDMTSMWLARKSADRAGIPYDYVMQFAQTRALARYGARMPRPNQLYCEEFEMDLLDDWRSTMGRSLRYSRLAQFKADAPHSPAQERHAAFVIAQIKRRPAPHTGLLARMFNEGVLSPSLVRDHFSEREIEQGHLQAKVLG